MIQRHRLSSTALASAVVALALVLTQPSPARVPPAGRMSHAGSARTAVVTLAADAGPDALAVPGIEVRSRQLHLGTAVVHARSTAAIERLVGRRGIRAVHEDSALAPNSKDDAAPGGGVAGVFASAGLGHNAGKRDAGRGTVVALVDTGIADTAALDRASGRLIDGVDTSDGLLQTDGYGHGTFMAGLIAGGPAPGSAGLPIGVAPGASVLNVKVADDSGETSLSKVLEGFDWLLGAVRSGRRVDVLSFSFSRQRPGPGYGPDPLTDAVESIRGAGVTVVVSAGNVPGEVGDPGFHPRVISVGAADLSLTRPRVASFSGGATVAGVVRPDVVASGVHVLGLLPPDSFIARAHPQSRHGELWRGSGTSQATATTAGVAALFRAEFPTATPREVKASLRAAAGQVHGEHSGAGLLRVARSLRDGTDGPSESDGGGDGEGGFDAGSWSAGSWSAGSWSAGSWSAGSWSAGSWSAGSWSSFWGSDGGDG